MPRSASTRPRIRIGCSTPGYSGYDSTRSNAVSARTRSTSNSGTNTAISPAALCAKTTGRSVDRKLKLVKYWMYVLVEEDVAGEPLAPHVLEEAVAPPLELGRRDAGARLGALLQGLRTISRRLSA